MSDCFPPTESVTSLVHNEFKPNTTNEQKSNNVTDTIVGNKKSEKRKMDVLGNDNFEANSELEEKRKSTPRSVTSHFNF
jgi:hypothetical protein